MDRRVVPGGDGRILCTVTVILRINRLAIPGLSHIGRPGPVQGTRELIEPPYIIVYAIDEASDEITVLAVLHGAQNREANEPGGDANSS